MSQEEQWKKEAEQLKKDLDNRRKTVKKREVEIKFGGVKKSTPKQASTPFLSTKEKDDFLRKKLGL